MRIDSFGETVYLGEVAAEASVVLPPLSALFPPTLDTGLIQNPYLHSRRQIWRALGSVQRSPF